MFHYLEHLFSVAPSFISAKYMLQYLLISLLSFLPLFFSEKDKINVAIIGSGLSGASLSYFLTHRQGHLNSLLIDDVDPISESLHIDLYEKENDIGGRTQSVMFEGCKINLGASSFTENQHFIRNYTRKFNIPVNEREAAELRTLGVWNGTGFPFTFADDTSRMRLWSRMVAKYGLWSPARTVYAIHEVLIKLNKLYGFILDKNHEGFSSSGDLVRTVGMANLLNMTLSDYLGDRGHRVSAKFIEEIIDPFIRDVFGGQDSGQVHALAGLNALVPRLLGRKALTMTEGADALVRTFASRTEDALGSFFSLKTGERVKLVVGEWHLTTDAVTKKNKEPTMFRVVSDKSQQGALYDIIAFATPLCSLPEFRYERIRHQHPSDWSDLSSQFPYHSMQVTLVHAGPLSRKYFQPHGLNETGSSRRASLLEHEDRPLPGQIFTTNSPNIPFITIQVIKADLQDGGIYKLFSENQVSDELLQEIFQGPVTKVLRKEWKASPEMNPLDVGPSGGRKVHAPSMEPAQDVFLTNAMEPLMCSMETQLISSFNIAKMMKGRIQDLLLMKNKSKRTTGLYDAIKGTTLLKDIVDLFNEVVQDKAAEPISSQY